MELRIPAIYQDGAFIPKVTCQLPENTEVQVVYQESRVDPPQANPADHAAIKKGLIERMRAAKLNEDAPRFTREELHERG